MSPPEVSGRVVALSAEDAEDVAAELRGAPWWVGAIKWASTHTMSLARLIAILGAPVALYFVWQAWRSDAREARADAQESAREQVQQLREIVVEAKGMRTDMAAQHTTIGAALQSNAEALRAMKGKR